MVSRGERKRPPTRRQVNMILRFTKQSPVLDLEALPNASGVFHSVADKLPLLSQLEIDLLLVVLTLDMGYIDGDEDICVEFLKAEQGHDEGREVWRRGALSGLSDLWCLGRYQSVSRDSRSKCSGYSC